MPKKKLVRRTCIGRIRIGLAKVAAFPDIMGSERKTGLEPATLTLARLCSTN